MNGSNRKEIVIDDETLMLLRLQAERAGRKLKNYMEFVLKEKANEFQLTDEYKKMMDKLLEQHHSGKAKYLKWEDIKEELFTER